MRRRTHSVRSRLDCLEHRDVPTSNLTVGFSAVTHTLTIVGDANADDVTVKGDAASQTHFTLTSSGNINGQPSPFSTPAGVKNLVFKLLGGNASITFDPTVPITVQGSVTFTGGTGVNSVTANQLTVGKNLSVTNAAHTTGIDKVWLFDFSAGGNVTVRNAGGNTDTLIERSSAGLSTIKGRVSVTNGTGADTFQLIDTNVDGSVTVNNGHGDASNNAGTVEIFNNFNSQFRSVIGGNLTVTYLDGNVAGSGCVADTVVLGNVTLNDGTGTFETLMDGRSTQQPVLILGNLTITGTGANTVDVGSNTAFFGNHSGLIVGKNFTLTSGGGTAETLAFRNFQVVGDTSLLLGDGGNTVTINDSYFGGRFTLVSGTGNDTFSLETTAGTSSATEFMKAVLVDLGTGNDQANIVSNGSNSPDAGEQVVAWSTFEVKSPGQAITPSHVLFPNGGEIHFEL
jgi:hypothetical protein